MVQTGELAYNDVVFKLKKKKFRLSRFAEEEKLYPSTSGPNKELDYSEKNDE
jgi:hypothetical protein